MNNKLLKKIKLALSFICAFWALAGLPNFAYATASSPRIVDVGIYLNNIPSVNLKEKLFQADFYIWFRWIGDDINPADSFELVNGRIDSKDGLVRKKIGGINYASYRVDATIYRNFELARYPLDNHQLKIQVEDTKSSTDEVIYRADKANMGISPKINVPGWDVGKMDSYESVTKYQTNFGDISLARDNEANFPRYTFSIELLRSGYGNFIKLFSMLFIAATLAFFSFRVRSDWIDARFALILSGVFLAAFTQSTLATNLPESDSFGLSDQLYNTSMAYMLCVFIVSIHTFKIFIAGAEEKANLISRRFGIYLPISYVFINLYIILN
ncbi:MAG: hypothetical protein WC742_09580 [Gallionellaceae bacterium]|jgi:hypothetical protein